MLVHSWKPIDAPKLGVDGDKAVDRKTDLEIYIHVEDSNSGSNDSSLNNKGLFREAAIETLESFERDDSESEEIGTAILRGR